MAAFRLPDHGEQPEVEHHFGELVHPGRRGRAGRPYDFAHHRVDRADVIDRAALELDRQLFARLEHVVDPLVCRIAPGQHLARQQQAVAVVPASHLFGSQRVEIDSLGRAVGLPGNLRIIVEAGRFEIGRTRTVEREMRVARGSAVGNHRHGLAGGMAGRIEYFHVEYRRQSAKALRTDAHGIDRIEDIDAQLLDIVLRAALLELAHVDRIHQALLRQLHAMLRRATDPDAQHPRGAPARAHRGNLFDHPVDDIVARVHHLELGLVLAAAALGRDVDLDPVPRDHFDRQDAGRVVARVAAGEGGIGKDRGAQLVVGMVVGAAHALIDDLLQRLRAVETAVLSPFDEHVDDSGVLAQRAMAFGAHAAVGQDLRDSILRRRTLLGLVGFAERADVIHRMVVRNVLERVRHALDYVVFRDDGHVAHRRKFPCCRFTLPDRRVSRHRSKRLATPGHTPKATGACISVLLM